MKRIFIPFLLIVMMGACKSNSSKSSKDSLNKISESSSKPSEAEILALIKKFKPLISGFWMNTEYIDEIKRTKSAQQAYAKVGWITDMFIDTSKIKSDSLLINYNSGNHEVFDLILKFHNGISQNSITAYDQINTNERNSYQLKFNKAGTFLTIIVYSKGKKSADIQTDSLHFFKSINFPGNGIELARYINNQILISGDYNLIDSAKTGTKVSYTNEGKVSGLLDFENYEILIDFMTPPNNLDAIAFDLEKTRKWYAFRIQKDTLNIYETKNAADSVDLAFDKLKYKLVRQK